MGIEQRSESRPDGLERAPLEPLLRGLIDYAGTFPPAGLEVERAAETFASARAGARAWTLSRLALALGDLDRLASWVAGRQLGAWPLTVVSGDRWEAAAARAADAPAGLRLEAFECRVGSVDDVERAVTALAPHVEATTDVVLEVPSLDDADWDALLDAIAARGARAKLRTGSVRAPEIPSPGLVAGFLERCAARRLPVKLTAGLHRALRAERALTYESDPPCGAMHGFVNAYAAAALAFLRGADGATLEACLACERPDAFLADEAGLSVNTPGASERFTADELATLRTRWISAFGSCSFDEPLEDLATLGWLTPA